MSGARQGASRAVSSKSGEMVMAQQGRNCSGTTGTKIVPVYSKHPSSSDAIIPLSLEHKPLMPETVVLECTSKKKEGGHCC